MTDEIKYYYDITQGTPEWLALKHGVLSASTFKNVITAKTLKLSGAEKTKAFYDEILTQRIDPTPIDNFVSWDMERGLVDEVYAIQQYQREYNPDTKDCGFIINRSLGFDLGFSPDQLVGDDGFLECKSRKPHLQIATILNHVAGRTEEPIPSDFMMQCQAGLFVTKRDWCDFISFSNGLPMVTIRVLPIPAFQEAIKEAAIAFEATLSLNMRLYKEAVASDPRLTLTERFERETGEMV